MTLYTDYSVTGHILHVDIPYHEAPSVYQKGLNQTEFENR